MAWGDLANRRPEDYLALEQADGPGSFDPLLSQALQKRYQAKTWQQVAQPFHEELGLKKYRIKMGEASQPVQVDDQTGDEIETLGHLIPPTGKIELEPALSGEEKISTAAHELAHAADSIYSGDTRGDMPGKPHHDHFVSFEPEMLMLLQAQSALENGEPVNPEILRRYPALKNVKPLSSNPLAHPWQGQEPKLPPIWNLIPPKK